MAVKMTYVYRDASNYKELGYAVFAGSLVGTAEEDSERLRAAAEGRESFVASQVGLEPLQPRMVSFPSPDDHGYSEIPEWYEPEEVPDADGITDTREWGEFLAAFECAGRAGWDPVAECEMLGIDATAEWDDEGEE